MSGRKKSIEGHTVLELTKSTEFVFSRTNREHSPALPTFVKLSTVIKLFPKKSETTTILNSKITNRYCKFVDVTSPMADDGIRVFPSKKEQSEQGSGGAGASEGAKSIFINIFEGMFHF